MHSVGYSGCDCLNIDARVGQVSQAQPGRKHAESPPSWPQIANTPPHDDRDMLLLALRCWCCRQKTIATRAAAT